MAHFVASAGTGQAVSPVDGFIKMAVLTAGPSAPATATIYGNGVPLYYLAAPAGAMGNISGITGGNENAFPYLTGPITVDVVGSGAKFTLDY